jgi:hypothetical protein
MNTVWSAPCRCSVRAAVIPSRSATRTDAVLAGTITETTSLIGRCANAQSIAAVAASVA